jgi:hypothetical protein
MGNNGNGIIGWEQFSIAGHYIYFVEYRGNGDWADFKRINISPESAYDTHVAVNDNGNGIIVWCDAEDAQPKQVYYIEYRDNGDWTIPTSISPSETNAEYPHVALSNGNNGNGDGIITWQQSDGIDQRIHYAEYRDGGDWTAASPISPGGTDAYNSQVAINDNGDAIIMWEQDDDTGYSQIWLSEWRNGIDWSTPFTISPSGADVHEPQLAMNNNGDAIITWHQFDDTGDGRIYMAEYRNQDGWSTPSVISPSGADGWYPQVAINDNGNAIITWQQSDGGDRKIYIREFY